MGFVRRLPPGSTLVLNGDTVNYLSRHMTPLHREAMALLRQESGRRRVVWVRGNHDRRLVIEDPQSIDVRTDFKMGQRVFVSHGHVFDNIMPHNRAFIMLFQLLHRIRVRLGAPSVHVAFYAKAWPFLYGILRDHVMLNAVEHAKENGYETMICGHTHYIEDRELDGIRYVNTGSWTEEPVACARVCGDRVSLERLPLR
jgi:UDP-2,3-diacylglucosamine pyrophosphatase LpxH